MAKCIKERRTKLLIALLDSGIRIRKGPLWWAAIFGDADIVRLLLQYGADIDGNGESYIDSLGMESPPLHGAVRAGNSEIVEILLLNGADPKVKDSKGRTPLQTCKDSAQRIEMQKIFTKHAGASDQ